MIHGGFKGDVLLHLSVFYRIIRHRTLKCNLCIMCWGCQSSMLMYLSVPGLKISQFSPSTSWLNSVTWEQLHDKDFYTAWMLFVSVVLSLAPQVVLIVSGNLSFLNWLTIVPSLACFDDASLGFLFQSRGGAKKAVLEIQNEGAAGRTPTPTKGSQGPYSQNIWWLKVAPNWLSQQTVLKIKSVSVLTLEFLGFNSDSQIFFNQMRVGS